MRGAACSVLAALALATSLAPTVALAQGRCEPASCDVIVDARGTIDGSDVAPGETVCLRAPGEPSSLTIADVHGTADAPVRFVPCGGRVTIRGSSGAALRVSGSSHLVIDGGEARALHVDGAGRSSLGVELAGCTEHVELAGLEISGTTYAGIRSHTEDASCRMRVGFWLHDLHVHDVDGEGLFLGFNDSSHPARLDEVLVEHNLVERTGYQGIKIGATVEHALVAGNVVLDAGVRRVATEDTGITGRAVHFRIERNVVVRTTASCVFVTGQEIDVIDNVLVGCGTAGVTVNGSPSVVRILHDTIVAPGDDGILSWASAGSGFLAVNNLLVDLPSGASATPSGGSRWTVEGNLTLTSSAADLRDTIDPRSVTAAGLAAPPFSLGERSPARDMGSLRVRELVTLDVRGLARDDAPDVGAHEAGATEMPPVTVMPDAGGSSDPDGGGTLSDDAGSRPTGSDASTRAADAGTLGGGGDAGTGMGTPGPVMLPAGRMTGTCSASAGGRTAKLPTAMVLALTLAAIRRARRLPRRESHGPPS